MLRQASDDQMALAFCFGALVISAAVMHFSFYLGRKTQSDSLPATNEGSRPRLSGLPTPAEQRVAAQDRAA
jgi:hypothetical protein